MKSIEIQIYLFIIVCVKCSFSFQGKERYGFFSFSSFQLIKNSKLKLISNPVNTKIISLSLSNSDIYTEDDILSSSVRKWYLMSRNKRSDIFLSKSQSVEEIYSDLWKGTLIANNLHENDKYKNELVNVYVFPNIKITNQENPFKAIENYQKFASETMRNMNISSPLFPTYRRQYEFLWMPVDDFKSQYMLLLAITSNCNQPSYVRLGDWNKDIDANSIKGDENILTNDIKSFPFPTIFDFISEINRPIDLSSRTQSRFNFRTKDLKYDLKKMAKKRDPQEFVDVINCRLTRLANWRDVLERDRPELNEMFIPDYDWAEGIKAKYQSLQTLVKTNPKRALETQYDKRKTFIEIIDRWSDRLKRHFSYIYKSRGRPPEDFMAPILGSKWRMDLLNITSWFQKVPYLELLGPDFIPGYPASIFSEDRALMWDKQYTVEVALYEMMIWMNKINDVITYTYGSKESNKYTYGPLSLQVYSRGDTTETVMFDTWTAIASWMKKWNGQTEFKEIAPTSKIYKSKEPMDISLILSNHLREMKQLEPFTQTNKVNKNEDDKDDKEEESTHMIDYLRTIRILNNFSRKESNNLAMSVRSMFQKYAKDAEDGIDWWVNLVRNLDMFDEMEQIAQTKKTSMRWSTIMNDFIDYKLVSRSLKDSMKTPTPWYLTSENQDIYPVGQDGLSSELKIQTVFNLQPNKEYEDVSKAVNIESNLEIWKRYKNTFLAADYINSILPWQKSTTSSNNEDISLTYNLNTLNEISKYADYDAETVMVDCKLPDGVQNGQLLVVLPRFFRGTGMDQELSAFLEFVKILQAEIIAANLSISITPFHPLMIDPRTGDSKYANQAPHPALLISKNR